MRGAVLAVVLGLAAGACGSGPEETEPGEVRTYEPVETADETVYAEEPYWYKPGHPEKPADARGIEALPGFEVERVLDVPPELGSWTALAAEPGGRLIAAAQHVGGLVRITPASPGDPGGETTVERLGGVASRVGWSHGLLHAHGALYVTVAEENDTTPTGVYRLRDTDGDDQYDAIDRLFGFDPAGEHGPHNLVPAPDGEGLYMIGGNGLPPPELDRRRPVSTTGVDHLMPRAFGSSEYTPAGWVIRMDPDGKNRELVSAGLRNSFDLAFNRHADLFTFDSDMEWDLGAPWYRPTRVCHLLSGGEFGWRADAAKWPEYYEDGVPPVVNVGPGSPTGVAFGYGAAFPHRYREALYVADWTFGAINAVHLTPSGAGYRAEFEEFVGGTGLPVTDVVVQDDGAGGDGALYFVVGGRRLGSALYRVRYTGDEREVPASVAPLPALHSERRRLEALHGGADPEGVDAAWPALGHSDRLIRFAARVAVESRPVAAWRERALAETDAGTALTALLALARQGAPAEMPAVLARLGGIPWEPLSPDERLRALRGYEVALARREGEAPADVRGRLRARFPDPDPRVERELSRLLCHLGDTTMIDPLLDRMAEDPGSRPFLGVAGFARNPKYGRAIRDMLESAPRLERMHHAQMLLWIEAGWTDAQHRRYFELIADARANSKGGHTYGVFWDRIAEGALRYVPEERRAALEDLSESARPVLEGLPAPVGPGREWGVDEALAAVEGGGEPDLEAGRRAYAAAGCGLCHRVGTEGGATGPDLSAVGQRFTARDLLESILQPSRTISDQYRVSMVETRDGRTVSGRIASRDARRLRIAENLMRPDRTVEVPAGDVVRIRPVPVSTMPSGLVDVLNAEELRDLVGYLRSAGRGSD